MRHQALNPKHPHHMISNRVACVMIAMLPWLVSVALAADANSGPKNAEAGESRDAESQFQAARNYLHGIGVEKNPKKAYELMKLAADQGHAEAMGGVGYFHGTGLVGPRNDAEAARWYRKGATNGGAKAQLNFGQALTVGRGVPKDEKQGVEWITRSADQG